MSEAIVSCHETFPPTPRPRFGQIARLPDGPGGVVQVTFGAKQATDRSDALDKIIEMYRDISILEHAERWRDVTLADELVTYLPRLAQNTPLSCAGLARDKSFLDLLARSSTDPLMREAQMRVFAEFYMKPSIAIFQSMGWQDALSLAVIYDSKIHGSFAAIRDLVLSAPEREWIRSYVETRHWHLANAGRMKSYFKNPLLRNTTYRMKTFEDAIQAQNFDLLTPVKTGNGVTILERDVDEWRTAA